MNFLNEAADKTGDFFSGLFDKDGKPKPGTTGNEYDLTEGDRTGMFGTSMGMYGPAMMTMLNKMQTPPNTNFFNTFGQDALRTQEEAEGLAGISKDEAYRKNLMRANALRKQLANSARGVGDIRSGQLTAELAEQEGARGILTNYLQGMSQLKGQRAQLQQQIDQTRMGGEYQRDLADRQDIDQYYTNLAENVANASNMMQKQGRDMNQAQYNKMILEMSPMFSKYGIGMERRNGKYVMTHNGEDIDQTKARLIVEKGIEAEKKAALEKASTTTRTVNPTTSNVPVAPVNSNMIPAINPLGLGNTPYFNPIFKDINIPTVTDKSMIKSATKRR
jgi:phosphohistidine swiveling domain-containing protein